MRTIFHYITCLFIVTLKDDLGYRAIELNYEICIDSLTLCQILVITMLINITGFRIVHVIFPLHVLDSV